MVAVSRSWIFVWRIIGHPGESISVLETAAAPAIIIAIIVIGHVGIVRVIGKVVGIIIRIIWIIWNVIGVVGHIRIIGHVGILIVLIWILLVVIWSRRRWCASWSRCSSWGGSGSGPAA